MAAKPLDERIIAPNPKEHHSILRKLKRMSDAGFGWESGVLYAKHFQRLGLPDTRYYALSSKHELEIEALKKEIVGCNVTRDVQNGFEQIEQLKNMVDDDDRLTQQFIWGKRRKTRKPIIRHTIFAN